MKKEVNTNAVAVKDTQAGALAINSKDAFKELLQGSIGLSPLATGQKFESDDLIEAAGVHLVDFDWVEYTENAGETDERDVKFTLWAVEVTDMSGGITKGYYQGGTVLNKLAKTIEDNDLFDELAEYGIDVNVRWGKTAKKKEIVLIDIL